MKTIKIENLISQAGYAKKYGISKQVVHYHVKTGKVDVVRLKDGTILINDK